MKKTLLVTLDFYPDVGGVSGYWLALGKLLDPKDTIVLAPTLPVGVQEIQTPYRIYRRRFFTKSFWPRWIPLFFSIGEVMKKEKSEMIIVGQVLPIGVVVRILNFFLKCPYVVSTHGMDITLCFFNPWKRFLCQWVLKGAKKILANSQFTSTQIQKLSVSPSRITCVYPCPLFSPGTGKETEPSHDLLEKIQGKYIVLTVARMVWRKGHEMILDACQNLSKKYPEIRFIFIGDGPYRKDLEQKVKTNHCEEYILFLGVVSQEQTRWWFNHCDLFVMTPREQGGDIESFGIVYLEAQSYGKPVIGTKTGGVAETIEDGVTGMLIEQNDRRVLSEKIQFFMSNPEYAKQIGKAGKERVNKMFRWEVQAEKLKNILS